MVIAKPLVRAPNTYSACWPGKVGWVRIPSKKISLAAASALANAFEARDLQEMEIIGMHHTGERFCFHLCATASISSVPWLFLLLLHLVSKLPTTFSRKKTQRSPRHSCLNILFLSGIYISNRKPILWFSDASFSITSAVQLCCLVTDCCITLVLKYFGFANFKDEFLNCFFNKSCFMTCLK